ncbi:MAG: hypothetical protein KatS3mg103_0129 [Phycisphaerales bacterium]|nr:MAG: hypothetical protein KatS3mg103_0129 [Phycisphaerales bacterium]
MTQQEHTTTWPDLAIGLYDRLTGRGAEIIYEFDNLKVFVPSGTGERATHAPWILNGTVRIRTRDNAGGQTGPKSS